MFLERRPLSLLCQGKAGKSACRACHERGFIERRKLEFGHNRGHTVHPGNELLDLMIEEWQFKISFAPCLGQTATRCRWIDVPLVLMVDHQVTKTDQLHRSHAFVRA